MKQTLRVLSGLTTVFVISSDMWLKHYSTLLNSVDESVNKNGILSYLNDCSNDYAAMNISLDDDRNFLWQAKLGTS